VPAVGFIAVAVGLLTKRRLWRSLLIPVTLFSLALTILDWSVAYAGIVVNAVILAIVWLGPRVAGRRYR
jgi:hypothetical protein